MIDILTQCGRHAQPAIALDQVFRRAFDRAIGGKGTPRIRRSPSRAGAADGYDSFRGEHLERPWKGRAPPASACRQKQAW